MGFIIPPRLSFRGSANIATVQRQRNVCRIMCVGSFLSAVGFYLLTILVLLPCKQIVGGIFSFLLFRSAFRACISSAQYFVELKKAFYEIGYEGLSKKYCKESGSNEFWDVRMSTILFCPDLEDLRDRMRVFMLDQIKQVRNKKRQLRSAAEQAKLQADHFQIDQEILALAQETGKERKIRRRLRRNLSLSDKKSMFLDLAKFAVQGSGSFVENREETKLQKGVDYLIDLSGGSLSGEAQRLHLLAKQSSDFKTKEQYLKQAIEAQKQFNREGAVAKTLPDTLQEAQEPRQIVSREINQLPLWSYARKVFVINELLPSNVDEMMATTILILLISPGDKSRRFQAKYWRESTLRREVIHHYERILKSSYQPTVFVKTLKWLSSEGAIFTKAKADEMMYALSAKPGLGKSPDAQEIIRRVVIATEVFKNGKVVPEGVLNQELQLSR